MAEAKTLDRSAGYLPYQATQAFWEAKGFSPADTIDPLQGEATSQPSGYLRCHPLAGDQRRLTVMRVTGDQSGKPQLRT
jgi:hypothetical protein